MRTLPLTLTAALATSLCAFAQAADVSPWYMGASVGYANNKMSNVTLSPQTSVKNNSAGIKLYGGYQISANLAAELEYVSFGKHSFTSPRFNGSVKSAGLGLSMVGILPLSSEFSLFGKAGGMAKFTRAQETYSFSSDAYKQNATKVVPMLGLGAEYKLTPALALRAEYEYVGKSTVGDDHAKLQNSLISAGLRYNF